METVDYNDELTEEELRAEEEAYRQMLDEMYAELEADKNRYIEVFENYKNNELKDLIYEDEYDDIYAEEFDPEIFSTIKYIGTCEIRPFTESKYYDPDKYFKIENVEYDDGVAERHELECIFEKREISKRGLYILVHQTCGITGDDFSGYIIWPLKDGKHWIAEFSM